jgi:type VI secretion system protein ImpK
MYTVLALGFEGKLRLQNGGAAEIERIQNNLFTVIRSCRGNHEPELAPRWEGENNPRTDMDRRVPLWVVAAVSIGIIGLSYFGFLTILNKESDPVAVEIASIGRDLAPLVDRTATFGQQQLSLKDLLEPEIRSGKLEVRDASGKSTVVLKGDGLFASGDAAVRSSQIPTLEAVGKALSQIPGQILITGHTDDVPIRSIRFPSNWHLSKERAESVRGILSSSVDPARMVAEPRSSNEPIVANDSAANRALNRRVEVTLFALPGRQ